jgi:hypothetical protein
MTTTATQPTDVEKVTIAEYSARLRERGFCRIDTPAYNRIQLFNRYADERDAVRSLAYVEEDFSDWLQRTGKDCQFRSASYIVRTLPLIVGTKFSPSGNDFYLDERTGLEYANTYRRYRPSSSSAHVSPLFHEFFERLAPSEVERTVLLQWLGHLFQRPQERPSWHILIPSDPGTGKGFMLESILHPLLHHTTVARSFKTVMGQFSSVLENSLLVLLDDCKSSSDSTQTQLKSILSEERQYVEKKHQQGAMVPTYTRFILASNERRALYLEADERRWFVLARAVHRVDREETQAFIAQLAQWLKVPGSLCQVWNYFQGISLERFNAKAVPESQGLAAMVAMSKSQCAVLLEDFVSDHPVFLYADFLRAIKDEGLSRPSDNQLPHLLRDVGYESTRLRLPQFGGEKRKVYHPIGMKKDAVTGALVAIPEPTF